eukprot:CAMPEP_0174860954 /NCGR_PEP_ID=MMETSP1114-20130205/50447_1 /TAXON_ID=312471 /ORGANISM="Neobodo designis, Strain CCAP 1951/1" /LENGTH=66 /DNA_ID=CAMNT_0016095941 /DNA_START=124 /DNA_END=324 /DNA_ORIENTATION=-
MAAPPDQLLTLRCRWQGGKHHLRLPSLPRPRARPPQQREAEENERNDEDAVRENMEALRHAASIEI